MELVNQSSCIRFSMVSGVQLISDCARNAAQRKTCEYSVFGTLVPPLISSMEAQFVFSHCTSSCRHPWLTRSLRWPTKLQSVPGRRLMAPRSTFGLGRLLQRGRRRGQKQVERSQNRGERALFINRCHQWAKCPSFGCWQSCGGENTQFAFAQ